MRPTPYSTACEAPCDLGSVMRALYLLSLGSSETAAARTRWRRRPVTGPAAGREGEVSAMDCIAAAAAAAALRYGMGFRVLGGGLVME